MATDTGVRKLTDGQRKNFLGGAMDNFVLTTQCHLGDLVFLRIWHDNSGDGNNASWFLSRVNLVDCLNDKRYHFLCNRWFAVDKDDGQIDRVIPVAGQDELEDTGLLVATKSRGSLFDQHLWLSVAFRPEASSFTRAQRLSCCISLLFLGMISNAMWYQTGGDKVIILLRLGIIKITWHEVYTSIMTCLTVMPVNMVIIYFFRSAKRTKDDRRFLPHWCLYLAWILVFISVITSAFFSVLYSFDWGAEKSNAWLMALILTMFQSALILDPLKVLIVIVLVSVLLKRPPDECDDTAVNSLPTSEKEFSSTLGRRYIKPKEIDMTSLKKMRKRRLMDKKVFEIFREILCHLLYLGVLFYLAYHTRDSITIYQNEKVRHIFLHQKPYLSKVKDFSAYWEWANSTLLQGLFATEDPSGRPLTDYGRQFTYDLMSMRMGPPRIRMLRVNPDVCSEVKQRNTLSPGPCNVEYSFHHEDTASYIPGWLPGRNGTNKSRRSQIFTFTRYPTDSSYWGQLSWYSANGYTLVLGSSIEEARDALETAMTDGWLDIYTRVVFMENTIYTPNINLFTQIKIVVEFPNYGSVMSKVDTDTVRLYSYAGEAALVLLIMQVVVCFVVIYITVREIRLLLRLKMEYFLEVWNCLDLVGLVFAYTSIGLYVRKQFYVMEAVEKVHNEKGKFVSFDKAISIDKAFTKTFATTLFITQLRLLWLLRFNRKMSLVGSTIRIASSDLGSFLACTSLIYIGFVISGYVMFGSEAADFKTLNESMLYLFTTLLGIVKYRHTFEHLTVTRAIYHVVYNVVMLWFFTSLLITVIALAFRKAQNDVAALSNDVEIVDYVWMKFKRLFSGNWSSDNGLNEDTKGRKRSNKGKKIRWNYIQEFSEW